MPRAESMSLRGTVATHAEASALLHGPGDAALIRRGRPRWLLISCPCGCGERFPINLDPASGPAWQLYGDAERGFTLYPSVWRESGCRSHYIIWYDKIYMCGTDEWEFDEADRRIPHDTLARSLQAAISYEKVPFWEIAAKVNAIPWDVLSVCRTLVRSGWLAEGQGKKRGWFGRK